MIALLGTLPFLATLWLLVVLGARILEESGDKIAAALKGTSPQRNAIPTTRPVRHRGRPREVMAARASLRAAA